MISLNQKQLLTAGAGLLLASVLLAAYFIQPLWLLLPVVSVGLLYLIQHPLIAFYLLLFSIPWSFEYNFSPGLGSDLPDEPLMLIMAAAILTMIVFHIRNGTLFRKIHPLVLLLALQMVWLLVTVALSSYVLLSIKFFLAKGWYLFAFVGAPLFFWRDEKIVGRAVIILVVSMIAVTAVTLLRHAFLGFTFSTINDALKPFFRNHVNYSALLVFMVPLQIALLQQAKTRNRRLLIWLSFFVTIPALYFSFARGAWLALLSGGASYWLLKRGWLFKSFILVLLMVMAAALWLKQNDRYLQFAHNYQSTIFHQDFEEHLVATYQLKDLSTAERFHRWVAGIRMAEDSWQTGFGPTTFYQHYKGYTVPAFKTWVSKNEEQSTVHNYFLLLLIEQGAMGLLLFLIMVGLLFWYAQNIYGRTHSIFWKTAVAAVACILVMQCTVNFLSDLIETDKAGSIFYLCVAALIIADRKTIGACGMNNQ